MWTNRFIVDQFNCLPSREQWVQCKSRQEQRKAVAVLFVLFFSLDEDFDPKTATKLS